MIANRNFRYYSTNSNIQPTQEEKIEDLEINDSSRQIMGSMNNMDENFNIQENQNSCEMKEQMKREIQCCGFAITDIALFLDTHPNDLKAICLHKKYCNRLRVLEDSYLKIYGPLNINCPCNKWRWLEQPWPWEGSDC